MKTKTFWILWNPEGKTPPTVAFPTLEGAREIAAKMQSRIGVGTMYVMECVAGVEVSLVQKWINPKGKK